MSRSVAVFPCSSSQHRLWLLEQLGRGGRSMIVRAPLQLKGTIEPEQVQKALDTLIRRHESLRTTFAELGGKCVQLVHPASDDPIDLLVTDLSGRARSDGGRSGLRPVADSLTEQPFDLLRGPLMRAHLIHAERSSVLLLAFHHIVIDGWSIGVLHDELRALLEQRPDASVRLPPLRVQYADFALWEQGQLSGESYLQDLDWWRALHQDAPDRPSLFGPEQENAVGGRVARQLDPGTVTRVRGLAAAGGATAFSVLLTAYANSIQAVTGQSDLVIGTPVAGRGRTDLEGVVGFFVNTLPLRVRVQPGFPLADRVTAVHAIAVDAIERQHVPFEHIARAVDRPDRMIFEVMFNLLEGPTLPGPQPVARTHGDHPADESRHAPTAGAHAAVELYVLDYGAERIDLDLVYATGQVDKATATKLLTGVVAALADRPPAHAGADATPVQGLSDADERWDGAIEVDVMSRFLRITIAYPEATAIRSPTASWTYAELATHVARIGSAIAATGGEHQRVGVLAGHNAEAVAAVLGVLAAGAAYVPLDASAPAGRLAAMIADADLHLVLHDGSASAIGDLLATPGLDWVDLHTLPPARPGWQPAPVEPDAIAYLLYTSGTTGEPKGVVQSHRNVLGHLRNYAESLRLAPGDIVSWLPGLGTDAAVMDIFGALLTGACLQPIDVRSVGLDELPGTLAAAGTTILHATPTLFRALAGYLAVGSAGEAPGDRLGSVRAVVLGGEAAMSSDLASARRFFGMHVLLVNGYGPTECTVALQFVADQTALVRGHALPLGRPVPGVLVSVLDEAGDPVGPGGVGEIVLHSRHLCLGYWRRPQETTERFLPGPVPGYLTGDLGRVHPDGTITFAGRADDQFKIHGVRIEATEVEAALRRQPGVKAAAVTHDVGLTAHLVVSEKARITTPATLRRGLRRLLPDAMIPGRFVQVDRLPLTPSGKIDRGALAALPDARPLQNHRRPAAATGDRWQGAVAAVWAEVLDVDPDDLGPDDNFFDFGGHSLLMTQVASRLGDRLGVRPALRTLFDNPSLSELAATVADLAAHSGPTEAAQALLPRRDHPGPYPLTSAQARLWFLEQLNPGTATYTMNLTLPVEGGSALSDVQSAIDQLIARHEALRTTFEVIDGTPWQRVHRSLRVVVQHTDLTGLDPVAAATRRRVEAGVVSTTVFDLRRGPLVCALFADYGPQQGLLFVAIHHIIADGWSLGLLKREFGLLLAASRDGRDPPLRELPIQYPDYALWEQLHLAHDEGGRWWRDILAGIPDRLQLPQSRPRPTQPTSAGGLVSEPLDGRLARALRRLARSRGVTPFMLYLAGFATVLHRWSGQSDLVIGTPVAGRTRIEVEGVVGLFVNSLPMRVPVPPEATFAALLEAVRDVVSAAQDHQSVPFEEIVRQAAPQRRLAAAPIFQVMFALGSTQDEASVGGPVSHSGTAKFDLNLTVDDGPVPGVYVEYSADVYDEAAARQLVGAMVRLLQEVATQPELMVNRIPLAPGQGAPEPQRPRSSGGSAVRLPVPGRGPGPAVVGPGGTVTHSQLADAVSGWVARLRSLALPQGSVVAVDLPRGSELIAAMLAVPAAGLCLLLLDPALPESRRRELLDQSGARAVLNADLLPTCPEVEELSGLPAFDADLPAYIVPTSGTTGTPKLVVVPRRALAAQIDAVAESYRLGTADRVLQFSALGFDVAIEEIWPTIAAGGCVELGPASGPPTFDELASLCGPGGVTVLNLPASYWHAWVASLGHGTDGERVPDGLRLVVVGSEPVQPRAVARWHQLTGCRLLCAYGTTETTITNALYEPPREWDWPAHDRVPIGHPLPTCRLLVVDPDGREVPPGVLGELAVEGICVADGYLGEAELTMSKFRDGPTGRRYLTGDLGRRTLFGAFEVLGRRDDQLKLAGHRIEPGEVEAALLRLPGVRSAAVAVRARPDGHPRLIGYLVGERPLLDAADLRAQLRRQLPEHLVPAEFMALTDLPRTKNGKLDRSRLPLPTKAMPIQAGRALAGALEWAVARVWAEVLRVPLASVLADSNFFHLGGDSILSLQVAWRLGAEGIVVTLAELFEHQSVAELAAAIMARTETLNGSDGASPGAGETSGPTPLLPIQRWALRADAPDPSHDNQAVLLQLDGSVTDERLRAALTDVIAHHDALRSRFTRIGGRWQVQIADTAPLPLDVHGPGAVLAEVAAQSHTSLSLDGPLIRADLLAAHDSNGQRDPSRPSQLLIVAHHLVIDFVSWQILLHDLRSALLQETDRPALPPAGTTWTAWSRRLASWANGPEALADARWWLDRLDEAEGLVILPAGVGGTGGLSRDEQVLRVVVDAATTGRLLELPVALDAGIEDALVAVVGRVIAETGSPAPRDHSDAGRDAVLLVDVEGHGREPLFADLDPTRLVGWLTTLRPVPVRALAGAGVADQVLEVRETLRSMPRHGLAYGAIRELRTVPDPDADALRHLPAAQVSVNYLGRTGAAPLPSAGPLTAGGPPPGPNRSPDSPRPYLFDVVAMVRDEQLVLWWSFAQTLTTRAEASALAARSVELLTELAATAVGDEASRTEPTPLASYPLTPMQEAMVYGVSSSRGSGVNIEQSVLPLPAGTDAGRLLAAWERLVARHDILRTRFVEDADGARRQEVLARVRVRWRTLDWSHLSESEAADRLAGLLIEDRYRGFAADRAPLMRLALIRFATGPRLLWSHHHSLLDGWSARALLDELAVLLGHTEASATLPNRASFRSHVAWLAQQDPAGHRAHWAAQFSEPPRPVRLPLMPADPAGPLPAGLGALVTDEFRDGLVRGASELRVSPATVIQAAWALVLGAYTGSRDVVFGVTSSGRPARRPESASIIGLMITTHPCRVRTPSGSPLGEWLRELAAVEIANREHAHPGLIEIARSAGLPLDAAPFDSLLVVENYRRWAAAGDPTEREPATPGGDVRDIEVREAPDVPLCVVVGADYGLRVNFDSRRLDRDVVASLLASLVTAITEIVRADPDATVGDIDVLGATGSKRALVTWNDTTRPLPEKPLGRLWAEAAIRHAREVAVVEPGPDGAREVSYAALFDAAQRIATLLRARGVRPGDLVGVAAERSAEQVVAVLGIVETGAAYVPLDMAYPDDRLALLVAETGMSVVVTRRDLLARLPGPLRAGAVVLDGVLDGSAAATEMTPGPEPVVDPASPAYVIFTSGSTGRPKGVVVPHRAVTRLVINTDYVQLGPGDTVAMASNVAFDASTFELWGPLLNGARIVIAEPDTLLSPPRLAEFLHRYEVSVMFLTTAAFNTVAAEEPTAFAGLVTLMFGGERVDPGSVRRVLRAGPPARLLHVYGPTEATTFASWHEVRSVDEDARTVPIGRPIANTELLVLDEEQRLVAPGAEGELCIGGPGLALGYLGDAELTSRCFVPHLYRYGQVLYRTGDIVVQNGDGVIDIRGRTDEQVKIRGFRIEPGEVETQLRSAPGVGAAVVVARREASDVHFLAAYVTPLRGAVLDLARVRAYLRERLPAHLVPATLTALEVLPQTPNGKVDRSALPDPRAGGPAAGSVDEQPGTDLERAVASIWGRVLRMDPAAIARGQDFFELGGHSLLLTQVAARLRDEFEVDIPLRVLFDARTLGDLADLVGATEKTPQERIRVADRAEYAATVDDHGRLVASPALRARLFVDE